MVIYHDDYEISHRERGGRWRRFKLPFTTPSRTSSVRLVALERGRRLIAWDDGDAVKTIVIGANGAVGPPRVVLDGVLGLRDGESPGPGWSLRSARDGTVVIAGHGVAPREAGAVYAGDPRSGW